MIQAIENEAQPEQQSLAPQFGLQPAVGARRRCTLQRREDTLDPRPVLIPRGRRHSTYFCRHLAYTLNILPALWWDHASGSESLPDVGADPLAIELSAGQHQPGTRLLRSRLRYNRR